MTSKETKPLTTDQLWDIYFSKRNSTPELPGGMSLRPKEHSLPCRIDNPSPHYQALKKHLLKMKQEDNLGEMDRLLRLLADHETNPRLHSFPYVEPLPTDQEIQETYDLSSDDNNRERQILEIVDLQENDRCPTLDHVIPETEAEVSVSSKRPVDKHQLRAHKRPKHNNFYEEKGKSKEAVGRHWYKMHLKNLGWAHQAAKSDNWMFIPPALVDFPVKLICKHAVKNLHYAVGDEGLYDMICQHGVIKNIPEEPFPIVMHYDCTIVKKLRAKLLDLHVERYLGEPANIGFHKTIMKLETIEYRNGMYVLDGQEYREIELIQHFVSNGIPNSLKLDKSELKKLEERVKFAHVDLNSLSSATKGLNGYSNEILNDNNVRPILEHFGFDPIEDGAKFYPPNGSRVGMPPMDIKSLRVFVREKKTWDALAGSRARMKTGNDDKRIYFRLRLWGATSPKPLPKYNNAQHSTPKTAAASVPATATLPVTLPISTQRLASQARKTSSNKGNATNRAVLSDASNRGATVGAGPSCRSKPSQAPKPLPDASTLVAVPRSAATPQGGHSAMTSRQKMEQVFEIFDSLTPGEQKDLASDLIRRMP